VEMGLLGVPGGPRAAQGERGKPRAPACEWRGSRHRGNGDGMPPSSLCSLSSAGEGSLSSSPRALYPPHSLLAVEQSDVA